MVTNPNRYSWAIVGLVLLCLLSFFWNLGAYGLFDLDEALYANCAREIHLSGNYVIPTVNGEPFYEKPPLVYWLAAASYQLFGRSEFTTRLPSAILSLAVTIGIFLVANRVFNRRTALLSTAFFCVAPLVFGSARQLTTDSTLDFCIFGAISCWFAGRELSRFRLPWFLCGCGLCAFGVLAKGLPGILIPCSVFVLYLWLEKRHSRDHVTIRPTAERSIGTLAFVGGVAVFLLIALPWHLSALSQGGRAFYDEYIYRQHIMRFRGGDTSHLAPFWFFVPGFLLGAFPWSFFVPAALLDKLKVGATDEPVRLRLLLKIWFVVVFVMFSASGSKLISYILPLYPAAALLAGDWCSRTMGAPQGYKRLFKASCAAPILSLTLLIVVLCRNSLFSRLRQANGKPISLEMIPAGTFEWVSHLLLATTLATVCFLLFVKLGRPNRAFGALVGGMALFLGFAVFEGLPLIDRTILRPLQSLAAMSGEISHAQHTNLILKTGGTRRPSVIFYLPDEIVRKGSNLAQVTESTKLDFIENRVYLRTAVLILADQKYGDMLTKRNLTTVLARTDGWVLLQTMPH